MKEFIAPYHAINITSNSTPQGGYIESYIRGFSFAKTQYVKERKASYFELHHFGKIIDNFFTEDYTDGAGGRISDIFVDIRPRFRIRLGNIILPDSKREIHQRFSNLDRLNKLHLQRAMLK